MAGWTEAYAAMYRDGAAAFPPACLHYVLEKVRRVGTTLTPADTVRLIRTGIRTDFGPLADEVMTEWEMTMPRDLGHAVELLGIYGCLTLDSDDTPGNFALDTMPLSEIGT